MKRIPNGTRKWEYFDVPATFSMDDFGKAIRHFLGDSAQGQMLVAQAHAEINAENRPKKAKAARAGR